MQKISYCLWFDGKAEEAANFYVSVFKDSRIVNTARYPEGSPGAAGSVMTVEFILNGEKFLALNGGPQYKFTPAISLVANCDTQEEIDDLWRKLTQGGQEVACGWLTDRFGVSWQIVPTALSELLTSTDKAAAQRAFSAMLEMKKLDLPALRRAYEGADSSAEIAGSSAEAVA
jgi:predicted 3-demethylubiquinone-9 3-methyltransferase (glyoxalase superfamily)